MEQPIQNTISNTTNKIDRDFGFFDISSWIIFLFILIANYCMMFIQSEFILTNEVYYNTLGEQLTIEKIDELLQSMTKWKWVGIFLVPLSIIIQCFVITCCINIGALLNDYKIKFKSLFSVVMNAMAIFGLSKLAWSVMMLFSSINHLEEIINLDYFSLARLIGYDNIPKWMYTALASISIWTVLFIAVLSLGIYKLLKGEAPRRIPSLKKAVMFTVSTYGTGFLIWIAFLMFLQLNLAI